jgi:hypothetical protein
VGGRLRVLVALGCVLVGLALLATAVAAVRADAPQPSYTVAATQACLRNLPTVVGLPPAKPPTPSLFVYRAAPVRVIPPAVATLWAFKGTAAGWEGIELSFFKTERSARGYARSLLNGHVIARNVVVATGTPSATWQKAVRACLRGGIPARFGPARTSPKASLATFVGYWGGHTRGLRISETGRGSEYASSGCCMRAYDLSFQITRVTGTATMATARYRVTHFKRYPNFDEPMMHVDEGGELRLRNGVVTDRQSDDYFCSDPAWEATGVCGA